VASQIGQAGSGIMKTEYRLCVSRGAKPRIGRYPKRDMSHATKNMPDYVDLIQKGLVNEVWVEAREVGEWARHD